MKKRKSRTRILILIIILLILCVLAAAYIVKITKNNDPVQPEIETEDIAAGAEESEEAAEEAAAAAEDEAAASHVYSHRGSQGEDEFTFDAYDRAVQAGSKYLEADMVVSADGTIYVAHDDYAKDMTGLDGYFSGMSDSQIDALKTRNGYNIIKLSDLFDKYGDSVTYIVDIKYAAERNITAFTDIVRKYGNEDNVIAASFYTNALRPLEDTFPEMTKLYLCADQGAFNAALGFDYLDILSVPEEIMTEDNLNAAHEQSKKFSVWTLNTEESLRKAIDMGVDSYFTDDSEKAISLEKEYRQE